VSGPMGPKTQFEDGGLVLLSIIAPSITETNRTDSVVLAPRFGHLDRIRSVLGSSFQCSPLV
jgi:hypothetical protein